jgi:predicted RNA-binding protein with PUA-like domain
MRLWLFKQEPGCYSFADLCRDGSTLWDGVTNALARQHLRRARAGDRVLFYHTGKEKAVVGQMRVVRDPQSDPEDPKAVAVEVAAGEALPRPVTLAEIKGDALLADWELVRLPRLSVVPVTEDQWRRVAELSRRPGGA